MESIEIGNLHVQVVGNDGQYALVKLYYPCTKHIDDESYDFYKGIVIRVKPENLYDIGNKDYEFPYYNLDPFNARRQYREKLGGKK